MSSLALCDQPWTVNGGVPQCSGTISYVEYTAPLEYTAAQASEAFFYGFTMYLPVLLAVFAGRQLLKLIKPVR